jgi:tetratricopeptide (TPR) repeat protein
MADIGLRLSGRSRKSGTASSSEEGSHWLARCLPCLRPSLTLNVLGLLNGAGWLAACQGKTRAARALNEELGDRTHVNDPLLVSRALINLGVDAQQRGEYGAARQLQEEALAVTRGNGDRIGQAMSLMNLTSLAVDLDDYAEAEKLGDEVLAIGEGLNSAWVTAAALTRLGWAHAGRGRLTKASNLLEESLTAARESEDRSSIAESLNDRGPFTPC